VYVPPQFVELDPVYITEFIKKHAFGTLITFDGKRPVASQLLLNSKGQVPSKLVLYGHMARKNPQWEAFGSQSEVLSLFEGPHAYVSASWYSINSAPTWNYITVQAYGIPRIIDDRNTLYELLKGLVDSQEEGFPESRRYRIESMPNDLLQSMMDSIVGFEINVTQIQCVVKLSQNRSSKDYDHITEMLKEQGDKGSVSIADEMKKRKLGTKNEKGT
jgi:transcriptional regulator